ncbi:MAG: ATP-binding protein [Clostridia bacterium]|nr:ATP-binding protein [Clostridia bacterium]
MTRKELKDLWLSLSGLGVFAGLLQKPLFAHFLALGEGGDMGESMRACGALVHEVYEKGGNFAAAVRRAVLEDENAYVRMRAGKGECDPAIEQAVAAELEILSRFAALTPADLTLIFKGTPDMPPYIPPFGTGHVDLAAEYEARMGDIRKHGYGIFAANAMFRLSDDSTIEPIASADTVSMDHFIGYEEERAQVLENTKAFLEGRPAANVLLYGDAGTGKSSTVKAVTNHLFEQGLRLIEIRKDQLSRLPLVMAKIRTNPLRFIIFIDDLSFNKSDDCFSMLKAALEGSAAAKAENAVIYATSNRRHIVRETFADREGGEVHRNDTMQETLSLSERFGMTVLFARPNKQLYLEIVRELAAKNNIQMEISELEIKAEAFALARGTRSARCAEHFIESLM